MSIAKKVPAAALSLCVGAFQFGDNGPSAATVPVKMVARSGQAITHWYWGRVVHDMAGMQLSKPHLPIDYVHDDGEVLGYLNKFDTSGGDLVASGALTPYGDDRASEVIFKAKAGVPYEASINFDADCTVEEIPAGASVEVNGFTFLGPGNIIRNWTLRGVAVCPYGADPNTSTSFKKGNEVSVNVTTAKGAPPKLTAEEERVAKLKQNLGENVGKYAAGIKFANTPAVLPQVQGRLALPTALAAAKDMAAVRLKAQELGLVTAQTLSDESGVSLHNLLTSWIPQKLCPPPDYVLFGARYWKPESVVEFRDRTKGRAR